jgi:hypothetical protein
MPMADRDALPILHRRLTAAEWAHNLLRLTIGLAHALLCTGKEYLTLAAHVTLKTMCTLPQHCRERTRLLLLIKHKKHTIQESRSAGSKNEGEIMPSIGVTQELHYLSISLEAISEHLKALVEMTKADNERINTRLGSIADELKAIREKMK